MRPIIPRIPFILQSIPSYLPHHNSVSLDVECRHLNERFGHDWDPTCMQMDESLYSIAEKVLIISLFPRTRFNLSLYFVRDMTTYVYTYSIYKVEKKSQKD